MCEARALWPEATSLFKFLGCGRPLLVEARYNTMATGDECRQKEGKDLSETASVQIYERATGWSCCQNCNNWRITPVGTDLAFQRDINNLLLTGVHPSRVL